MGGNWLLSDSLDAATAWTELGLAWIVQSTAIIVLGMLAAAIVRRRHPAILSVVYQTTLVAALAAPLVAYALATAGMTFVSIELPQPRYEALETMVVEPAAPEPLAIAAPAETLAVAPAVHDQGPVAEETHLQPADADSALGAAPFTDNDAPPSFSPASDPYSQQPEVAVSPPSLSVPPAPAEPIVRRVLRTHRLLAALWLAIPAVWLAGSLWLLLRLATDHSRLNALRRAAVPADAEMQSIAQGVARRMNVPLPELLRTPLVASPCLCGLVRPAILLPEELDAETLPAVLAHELAHRKRGDLFWNLLRHVAVSLLWPQPLVWQLSRRLEAVAEDVCDDYVVALGGCPQSYAAALVAIAERDWLPNGAAVSLVTFRSMLGQRVQRILDGSRTLSLSVGLAALGMIAAGGATAALMAGLLGAGRPIVPVVAAEENAEETNDNESPASADEKATEEADSEFPAATVDSDNDLITIRGVVLDPEGKPTPSAQVSVVRYYWHGQRSDTPLASASTNADGRYEVSYRKSQFAKNLPRPDMWREAAIVATHDGYGPGWTRYSDIDGGGSTALRLVADQPIEGRIVDLEGRPIAGVRVELESIYRNDQEDLTRWVDAMRRGVPFFGSEDFGRPNDGVSGAGLSIAGTLTTSQDGTFTVRGIGKNRYAVLKIRSADCAAAELRVVTMPVESFAADFGQAGFKNLLTYYGSRFSYSAEPSQPIEGIVRDAVTKQPLPGVRIFADQLAGKRMSGLYAAEAVSDAEGRYRIHGLPKGEGNGLLAVPNDDQPYFMRELGDVPTADGLKPVSFDIDLHRGIWITGRLTEKDSGTPVQAHLHYVPWPDNPHIEGLPEFNTGHLHGSHLRYETDPDGRFRLVGLPGRGLVAADTLSPYPAGQGVRELKDLPPYDVFRKVAGVYTPTSVSPTAVLEVHPEVNQDIDVDFRIDPGSRIPVRFVDASGRPASGLRVQGLLPKGKWREDKNVGPDATLVAFGPHETRLLFAHDELHSQGKALLLTPESIAEGTLSVSLERCATIKARILDAEGQPLPGLVIRLRPVGEQDWTIELPSASTDEDGRVETQLLPGIAWGIYAESPQVNMQPLAKELNIVPGETIDLGEFDITSDERPEPKRTQLAAVNETTGKPVDSSVAEADPITIRGVVLTPEAKPAEGINVRLIGVSHPNWPSPRKRIDYTTGADGRFELALPPGVNAENGNPWPVFGLFAVGGDTYAMDLYWYEKEQAGTEATIKLRPQSPIEGRIVNLEGQPVPGVRVTLEGVSVSRSGDLTPWINALRKQIPRQEWDSNWGAHLGFGDLRDLSQYQTETDADGRFRMLGVGPHQVAQLKIGGGGVVAARLEVANVDVEPIRTDSSVNALPDSMLYGSKFEVSAEPSPAIEGIVKDANTGEPIGGIRVASWRSAGANLVGHEITETISDENGHYRLEGMPAGEGNQIFARPSGDQPYLTREFEVPASRGLDPVKFDLELHRGVLVRGKVRDADTRKPLQGQLIYLPWPTNPRVEGLPEFTGRRLMGDTQRWNIDKDGNFTVVGLPGRGVLVVRTLQNHDYPRGQGFDKLREPITPGSFERIAQLHEPSPDHTHAILDLEIADNAQEATADIDLVAGNTIRLTAVDPEGQPADITEAFGLWPSVWRTHKLARGQTVNVTGLKRDESREVTLVNFERGLGANLKVSLSDSTPRAPVKLQPLATVTGRLVNGDGDPMPWTNIDVESIDDSPRIAFNDVNTDRDGRFKLQLVAISGPYRIRSRNAREPLAESLTVEPGETIDLGTIDGTSNERPAIKRMPAQITSVKAAGSQATATNVSPQTAAIGARDPITFTGTVLAPNGQPQAGAKVLLAYRADKGTKLTESISAADGTFKLEVPRRDFVISRNLYATLAVRADGFGVAWNFAAGFETSGDVVRSLADTHLEEEVVAAQKSRTLQLVPDQSIRGRIVNLEGQPVAAAQIRVHYVQEKRGQGLDAWLAAVQGDVATLDSGWRHLTETFSALGYVGDPTVSLLATSTDADGRFTLTHVGRSRLAHIIVSGPGIESHELLIRTLSGDVLKIAKDATEPNGEMTIVYPAEFQYAAAPSLPLVGTVRDADTDQPLAGVEVTPESVAGINMSGRAYPWIRAVTDQQGRYRLEGLPIGENVVAAVPADDMPYAIVAVDVELDPLKPQTVQDFKLKRGVWIRGRVIDGDTDKPLTASVQYLPFSDNELLDSTPGLFRSDERTSADADGRFSLVGIPGHGLITVMVTTNNDRYPRGGGMEKISGTDMRKHLRTYPWLVSPVNTNYLVELNIDPSATEIEQLITISAGRNRSGTVLDPDGKPLAGAGVSGTNNGGFWEDLPTHEFTVKHLAPGESRKLTFHHAERNLSGSVEVKADEVMAGGAAPLVVTLQPAGTVTGQVRFENGDVASRVNLWAGGRYAKPNGGIHPGGQPVLTDADGRFTLSGLVPGLIYDLDASRASQIIGKAVTDLSVATGETKDLGELTIPNP